MQENFSSVIAQLKKADESPKSVAVEKVIINEAEHERAIPAPEVEFKSQSVDDLKRYFEAARVKAVNEYMKSCIAQNTCPVCSRKSEDVSGFCGVAHYNQMHNDVSPTLQEASVIYAQMRYDEAHKYMQSMDLSSDEQELIVALREGKRSPKAITADIVRKLQANIEKSIDETPVQETEAA